MQFAEALSVLAKPVALKCNAQKKKARLSPCLYLLFAPCVFVWARFTSRGAFPPQTWTAPPACLVRFSWRSGEEVYSQLRRACHHIFIRNAQKNAIKIRCGATNMRKATRVPGNFRLWQLARGSDAAGFFCVSRLVFSSCEVSCAQN
jgi:hypothetical protein